MVGLSAGDLSTLAADARYAESLGFDDVACGEHAFFRGSVPDAFVALAAAAGATSTVRLVSAISLSPLYPAALFAKLVASLDVVSGGRFELGLGAGGEYPPEFEACRIDPATRFRRLEESVTVCRLLFGGGPSTTTVSSAIFTGWCSTLSPPSVPGPRSGWLGGRGRRCKGWAASPTGIGPGGPASTWSAPSTSRDFSCLADRYLFVGTPEQIVERVGEYAAAGVDRVIMAVAAGDADRRRVVETIAEDVLPALSKL